MAQEDRFDIKKAIEKNTAPISLQDLAVKGVHRVRVIDEKTVTRLIEDAVQRTLSARTNLLTEQERKKIYEDSRKELDRLIKEQQTTKQQADLMVQDKNQLVRDVENLQQQLQLLRKVSEEEAKRRYDEGVSSQRPVVESMKTNQANLEAEVRRLNEELQKNQANQKMIDELTQMNEATRAQFGNKLNTIEETLSSRSRAEQEQSALWGKLQELGEKDDQMANRLEALFSRMTENLGRKIQGIRLRAMAGEEVPYKPGELTLESLFKEELESNLRAIGIAGAEAGQLGEAADKLRAMKHPQDSVTVTVTEEPKLEKPAPPGKKKGGGKK